MVRWRAVSMLRDRLNEARQIASDVGGAALSEVQRQSRILDYFSCRSKIEQASENRLDPKEDALLLHSSDSRR
jgi:hypothetical protein